MTVTLGIHALDNHDRDTWDPSRTICDHRQHALDNHDRDTWDPFEFLGALERQNFLKCKGIIILAHFFLPSILKKEKNVFL